MHPTSTWGQSAVKHLVLGLPPAGALIVRVAVVWRTEVHVNVHLAVVVHGLHVWIVSCGCPCQHAQCRCCTQPSGNASGRSTAGRLLVQLLALATYMGSVT